MLRLSSCDWTKDRRDVPPQQDPVQRVIDIRRSDHKIRAASSSKLLFVFSRIRIFFEALRSPMMAIATVLPRCMLRSAVG